MFKRARIKLTAWYLLIIMLISMSFSMVIYRVLTSELDRLERVERIRVERRLPQLLTPTFFDPDILAETKQRLVLSLVAINAMILAGSAIAGYFLAGRTLEPIADILEEQNLFVTNASHELRTPLTSLKAEIEVNLRNKSLTINEAKKLLQSNLEEVNNLQELSDNLIRLTQFQNGNTSLPVTRVQLSSSVNEAIRRVTLAAKTKRVSITSAVPNLMLTGNAVLLTELFIILLDNAVKYGARGKKINIDAKKTDDHIEIRVTDQGSGIRKEDIPHLFDRFWRADKSRTKTDIQGYGLGLSIGKQIVERHHGTIRVESSLGMGTTFIVTLPGGNPKV